jgi:hypothetical protein
MARQDGYSLGEYLAGTYDPILPHCQKIGAAVAARDNRCQWLIREAREALQASKPSALNRLEIAHCATLSAFLAEMGVER